MPFFEVIVQDWSSLKSTSENTATNIPLGDIQYDFHIKRCIIEDWEVLGLFYNVYIAPLDKQLMSSIYIKLIIC